MNTTSRMLSIIESCSLSNRINEIIVEKGWQWILPVFLYNHRECSSYFEAILSFASQQGQVFRSSLGSKFFREHPLVYEIGVRKLDVVISLSENTLSESESKEVLFKSDKLFGIWSTIVCCSCLEEVLSAWKHIERKLSDEESLYKFLRKKSKSNVNVLMRAMCNKDYKVLESVWELSEPLMNEKEKRKDWLSESVNGVDLTLSQSVSSRRWLYKFLSQQIMESFLTKDEVADLLFSINSQGQRYLLDFGLKEIPNSLLSFQNLLSQHLRNKTGDILTEIKYLYSNIFAWRYHVVDDSDIELDVEYVSTIETNFESLQSSADMLGIIDPLRVNDKGFILDIINETGMEITAERFKIFIVIFLKQVELEFKHLNEETLYARLRGTGHLKLLPSVLFDRFARFDSFTVGYICAALCHCIGRQGLAELFIRVEEGDMPIHFSDQGVNMMIRSKLNNILRNLLEEDVEQQFARLQT